VEAASTRRALWLVPFSVVSFFEDAASMAEELRNRKGEWYAFVDSAI
jgi:hypothetical protein